MKSKKSKVAFVREAKVVCKYPDEMYLEVHIEHRHTGEIHGYKYTVLSIVQAMDIADGLIAYYGYKNDKL